MKKKQRNFRVRSRIAAFSVALLAGVGVLTVAPSPALAVNSVPCNNWGYASILYANGNRSCFANSGWMQLAGPSPRQFCAGNNTATFGVLRNWWDSFSDEYFFTVGWGTCRNYAVHSVQSIRLSY